MLRHVDSHQQIDIPQHAKKLLRLQSEVVVRIRQIHLTRFYPTWSDHDYGELYIFLTYVLLFPIPPQYHPQMFLPLPQILYLLPFPLEEEPFFL